MLQPPVAGKEIGMRKLGFSVLGFVFVLLGAGSLASAQGDAQQPLKAVTTIAMIGDVVREVGGARVSVHSIMGEGVDPHLYKATRSDMAKMLRADIIFYNGLMLEGKMIDALTRIAKRKPVFAVTELIDESELLTPDMFKGHHDPHVWMDPVRWAMTVDVIRDHLSDLDPDGAALYQSRAAAYHMQLQALHEYAASALATIPTDRRVLVTAHDAFNYLADRHGLEVMGIQGISTESEAGIADIEQIVNVLVERKLPAVFIETTVTDRNVKALIAGARASGHNVVIGGALFSDAMGQAGTYRGTYIGMIDHNVTMIVRALGGSAPSGGFQGKLEVMQDYGE